MSMAYKCENCGTLYEEGDSYDLNKFKVRDLGERILRIYIADTSDIYSVPQDICNKCMRGYLEKVLERLYDNKEVSKPVEKGQPETQS